MDIRLPVSYIFDKSARAAGCLQVAVCWLARLGRNNEIKSQSQT